MADGHLESTWSQFPYAKRALSPVRLVLKVTLFLLLYCTEVFLCIWGVLTGLDHLPACARRWPGRRLMPPAFLSTFFVQTYRSSRGITGCILSPEVKQMARCRRRACKRSRSKKKTKEKASEEKAWRCTKKTSAAARSFHCPS